MFPFARLICLIALSLFLAPAVSNAADHATASTQPNASGIAWQPWSDAVFAQAKIEHKFILMDLEAVWCHWCHVMDEVTYRDPDVIRLVREKYIAVKVDQDSRPDISNRYEDYGWPATVVFNADGGEIVKRQGYLPPRPMARMLQAIIDDPTPGPSVRKEKRIDFSLESSLAPALRTATEERLAKAYDLKLGGWGTVHKFVDWDAVEYMIRRSSAGDEAAGQRARQTLTAGLKLIDPVWGGVYQYSVEGDWDHAHFEKLAQFQSEILRVYALGWVTFHDPAYLKASQDIRRYLNSFLRDAEGGAYFVSQDADLHEGEYAEKYFALDDAGRRREGIPRVDRHVYARENGWVIRGLADAYAWTGDADMRADAERAAAWIGTHRAMPTGGFHHDDHDVAGPYLGDSLAMGRAFLHLYEVTAGRAWLAKAESAARFIGASFGPADAPGFPTAAPSSDASTNKPRPQVDENVAAVRFFNLLFRYTAMPEYQAMAQRAMRFLATPQVIEGRGFFVAGILLADNEVNREPLHVTVIGGKSDPIADQLFHTARGTPTSYRRIEWWDTAEGPLPNADVQYPKLKSPAAFLCTDGACSSPIAAPAALAKRLGSSPGR